MNDYSAEQTGYLERIAGALERIAGALERIAAALELKTTKHESALPTAQDTPADSLKRIAAQLAQIYTDP